MGRRGDHDVAVVRRENELRPWAHELAHQRELEGRLQRRYGYAKDQAQREIDVWLSKDDDPL